MKNGKHEESAMDEPTDEQLDDISARIECGRDSGGRIDPEPEPEPFNFAVEALPEERLLYVTTPDGARWQWSDGVWLIVTPA